MSADGDDLDYGESGEAPDRDRRDRYDGGGDEADELRARFPGDDAGEVDDEPLRLVDQALIMLPV